MSSEVVAIQSELVKYERFYKDRTTEVKKDYTQAVRDGDTAGAAEARDDWNHLQTAKKENGFTKAPLGELLKAPFVQANREKLVIGGVTAKRNNKGFLQQRAAQ